jgi:hypothetical protein
MGRSIVMTYGSFWTHVVLTTGPDNVKVRQKCVETIKLSFCVISKIMSFVFVNLCLCNQHRCIAR